MALGKSLVGYQISVFRIAVMTAPPDGLSFSLFFLSHTQTHTQNTHICLMSLRSGRAFFTGAKGDQAEKAFCGCCPLIMSIVSPRISTRIKTHTPTPTCTRCHDGSGKPCTSLQVSGSKFCADVSTCVIRHIPSNNQIHAHTLR